MSESNLNYIGPIPPLEYFHPEYVKIINTESKLDFTKYKDLKEWHSEQVENNVVYDLNAEMLKYCTDDVKLLMKAVLIFRSIIIQKTIPKCDEDGTFAYDEQLNTDPFAECITLPSLAVKINRQNFIIPNTIEAYTDSKKRDSKKAMGWLYHLNNRDINAELNLKVIYSPQTRSISANVYNKKLTATLPNGFKFEYHFKNTNLYSSLSLDALCR